MLDRSNAARRSHARLYENHLGNRGDLITPKEAEYGTHVYHVYAVRVKGRDQLQRALTDRGIASGIHYPIPIHLQEAYGHLKLGRDSFPVAERCAEEFLSLPMFPELTPEQIEAVVREVNSHLSLAKTAHACAV